MKQKIEKTVLNAINHFNDESEIKIDLVSGLETRLFGGTGVLDSLGLVNLIVMIEEAIELDFSTSIILADEKAMSRRTSPFSSVKTLINYIEEILTQNS
jgi:D-alanine--poly(phosphoribitol) ligase subunit 2